jgi:hypothetical protein
MPVLAQALSSPRANVWARSLYNWTGLLPPPSLHCTPRPHLNPPPSLHTSPHSLPPPPRLHHPTHPHRTPAEASLAAKSPLLAGEGAGQAAAHYAQPAANAGSTVATSNPILTTEVREGQTQGLHHALRCALCEYAAGCEDPREGGRGLASPGLQWHTL